MISKDGLRPAVVVTGASSGIGRSMAKVAARERPVVVLIGRSDERLSAVAAEIRSLGSEPLILSIDLLGSNSTKQVQKFLFANGLVCDVLVNSAGNSLQGLAATLPLDDQLGLIDVNARVLTELTLALVPSMVARRRGGVLNLSSVAGLIPGPHMAVYYATKSYVHSFSQALYQELRHTGVMVTCVVPGPVETGFLRGKGIRRSGLFASLPALYPDEVAECAWRGFKKRRRLVVPGISSKIAVIATALMPSALALRYLSAWQQRIHDKCPCGSGKNFLSCCGKTAPDGHH